MKTSKNQPLKQAVKILRFNAVINIFYQIISGIKASYATIPVLVVHTPATLFTYHET